MHTSQDTSAHLNLDYWLEQVKATVAVVAHLAVPYQSTPDLTHHLYLPLISSGSDERQFLKERVERAD